ncbi:MAG: copper resistance system multicopper oxidase [Chthoniobacterales bacterium]
MITRRDFLRCGAAAGLCAGIESSVPAYARSNGGAIDLTIAKQRLNIGGRGTEAITINGSLPGPLLRLREGQDAVIRVTNTLAETTSIHWHGLILPFRMDGVPGVSYAGIRPNETFTYRFPVRQNGTYWYHSHSAAQEQLGVLGPLIIEPRGGDPFHYDREYVVVLGDWLFVDPAILFAKLKKDSSYSNYQRRTVGDFFQDIGKDGLKSTFADRWQWGKMRMDPTDIADITGHHFTFLMNGLAPESNWTGLFRPGERVRLRFINSAAVTFFDVRVPGLPMTVVQADGQNVKPVTVDEFRIGIAETYDVIVRPNERSAYTIFAETIDRSGFARGTLATREGMTAAIPERRKRPVRTMADMGMAMAGMGGMDKKSAGGNAGGEAMPGMKASTPTDAGMADMAGMKVPASADAGMAGMKEKSAAPPAAGGAMPGMDTMAAGGDAPHGPDKHGPGNSVVAMNPKNRSSEPGTGLEGMPWRVLTYADLESLEPNTDQRPPERELEIHATGNMERYMWSFDGKKYSDAKEPISFYYGERLRWTWVNDTMMEHPLHLHGMFMALDNGRGANKPLKHTIILKPGERLSVDINVDAPGVWAFHCHVLYHMEAGMFRVVSVTAKT